MMTLTSDDYYTGFRDGDEKALEYVYRRYYSPLCNDARQIIRDEFTISCIVHEAFLKGWQFRQTMENMQHIYCFLRKDIRWKCYSFLASPVNHFHRGLVHYEDVANLFHPADADEDGEDHLLAEKKLKAIEEALPYLPANRQTIMTLYFRYGYSYKRIAARFGTSKQAISVEVQKSLESLKKIVHAQKKLTVKATAPANNTRVVNTENMDPEMQHIFKLHYEQKHSFASIAERMNVTQGYVQQQYVIAHRRLRQLQR
jgi:RNA polymerase sigma factor (sigma-70 family)